ncbi:hypothetical protein BJ166DRAFT_511284 [Pestalotiopsis sp. NC0098]|nr:hypothetical protein BJ166DRAFT_511284 [Pestalotiopsis sp. NC0098]
MLVLWAVACFLPCSSSLSRGSWPPVQSHRGFLRAISLLWYYSASTPLSRPSAPQAPFVISLKDGAAASNDTRYRLSAAHWVQE